MARSSASNKLLEFNRKSSAQGEAGRQGRIGWRKAHIANTEANKLNGKWCARARHESTGKPDASIASVLLYGEGKDRAASDRQKGI